MNLWWDSAALGLVAGIVVGYLWWRLPIHVQMVRDWRGRRIRAEVDRIRGSFSDRFYIPNSPPPPFLRMRILEYFHQWWTEMTPRTPEEVAQLAHTREINGNQQDRHRRRVVRGAPQAALRQSQRGTKHRQQAPRRTQESVSV